MSNHFEWDHARRTLFHDKLSELIMEFPELMVNSSYDTDTSESDYDPSTPKMLVGQVLVIAWQNMENYTELFYTDPLPQNHFLSLGMVTSAKALMEE
jgi:hypothetical protein